MVANLAVLVLEGGKGTRMKSATPKPLHKIFGLPLLAHILQTADTLKPAANVILCGHQADLLKQTVKENYANWGIKAELKFALQKILNGSGSAVKYAMPVLKNYKQVLILAGDAPLIEAETLKQLVKHHNAKKAACTVLTVEVPNPKGYGRIVKENNFVRIVEESETDAKTAPIKEVNSGMYIFEIAELAKVLKLLKPQGPKQEYYLTDTLALLQQKGKKVREGVKVSVPSDVFIPEFDAIPDFRIRIPFNQIVQRSRSAILCFHLNGNQRVGVPYEKIHLDSRTVVLVVIQLLVP